MVRKREACERGRQGGRVGRERRQGSKKNGMNERIRHAQLKDQPRKPNGGDDAMSEGMVTEKGATCE